MTSKATTPKTTTPATATKTAQSASITMRASGAILTLYAARTAAGGATTTVTTKRPNEKPVRGMTETHKTFEAAKARLTVLVKEAEKAGWARGEFRGGTPKPDAFTSMPAAPTAVAEKADAQ
jgi:hypothetical protein